MSTRRFIAFALLITLGFGSLPAEGRGIRTTGKIALALAAVAFALRPESRRRMAGAATSAIGSDDGGLRKRPARLVVAGLALLTAGMLALVVFDGARIGEILTLGDALLRYAEVDAYLWLVCLAIAGRSWRLELNRERTLRRTSGGTAPATAAKS